MIKDDWILIQKYEIEDASLIFFFIGKLWVFFQNFYCKLPNPKAIILFFFCKN